MASLRHNELNEYQVNWRPFTIWHRFYYYISDACYAYTKIVSKQFRLAHCRMNRIIWKLSDADIMYRWFHQQVWNYQLSNIDTTGKQIRGLPKSPKCIGNFNYVTVRVKDYDHMNNLVLILKSMTMRPLHLSARDGCVCIVMITIYSLNRRRRRAITFRRVERLYTHMLVHA